jgi:hypothetical protein
MIVDDYRRPVAESVTAARSPRKSSEHRACMPATILHPTVGAYPESRDQYHTTISILATQDPSNTPCRTSPEDGTGRRAEQRIRSNWDHAYAKIRADQATKISV